MRPGVRSVACLNQTNPKPALNLRQSTLNQVSAASHASGASDGSHTFAVPTTLPQGLTQAAMAPPVPRSPSAGAELSEMENQSTIEDDQESLGRRSHTPSAAALGAGAAGARGIEREGGRRDGGREGADGQVQTPTGRLVGAGCIVVCRGCAVCCHMRRRILCSYVRGLLCAGDEHVFF